MPRALSIQRTTIPPTERARYMERMRARAAHCRAANCSFSILEDTDMRGAFIELTEAADTATLTAALVSAPGPAPGPLRLFKQVELE